jgi:hypothetical protein
LGAALARAPQRGPAGDRLLRALGRRHALWDLKARLLELPLVDCLPRVHDAVPVYGSGGFCSYSLERLREQLAGWVANGIPRVKMKISREPERDPKRLDAAASAIGDETELYVDSNGAFARSRRSAGRSGSRASGGELVRGARLLGDLEGLRLLREHGPRGSRSRRASTPTCPPTSATSSAASTACRPT